MSAVMKEALKARKRGGSVIAVARDYKVRPSAILRLEGRKRSQENHRAAEKRRKAQEALEAREWREECRRADEALWRVEAWRKKRYPTPREIAARKAARTRAKREAKVWSAKVEAKRIWDNNERERVFKEALSGWPSDMMLSEAVALGIVDYISARTAQGLGYHTLGDAVAQYGLTVAAKS